MKYCKKVVAFLDSITDVDSRVFFPRQLCSALQLGITLVVFTRSFKVGVGLSGSALEFVQVLVSDYHV